MDRMPRRKIEAPLLLRREMTRNRVGRQLNAIIIVIKRQGMTHEKNTLLRIEGISMI